MDANNLLGCNTPGTLVGWLARWGAGCGHCNVLTRPERRLCPACNGANSYLPLSKRKLRLLACACCRFVWKHLDDEARHAVCVAERFAEGQAILPELNATYVRTLCNVAASSVLRWDADAAKTAVQRVTELLAALAEAAFSRRGDGNGTEERDLCDAIRDLIDDPFRPRVIDPTWLDVNDGQVRAVAACIDLDGRFTDLPILGDALEEAGCNDERILEHARRPRHYRGCWLLDAVLGKS